MSRHAGRRIVVTGAASGIGRASALRLLDEGASVHAMDIDESGLSDTTHLASQAGTAANLDTVAVDISDEHAVESAFGTLLAEHSGLDGLVNAAGILSSGHTATLGLAEWNRILAVNLTGTFLVTRAALPALLHSRGAIVNFSSTSANFGHPYMAAYSASKGGVEAFTHALAVEYGHRGLRVTALQPGGIDSAMTRTAAAGLPPDVDVSLFGRLAPLLGQGFADPGPAAGAVAMLLSDDGRFISGTELRIDGGAHA